MSATSNTRTSESEVLHEFVQRIHHVCARFGSQMRVDLSCPRAAMPKVFLDDAQIHSGFQQMRRVRMSKRMNVGAFGDARSAKGALEGLLQAAGSQRVN